MDVYGLFGKSLTHSFSKFYFNEKFRNEGIEAKYYNFEKAEVKDILDLLFATSNLKGLNVTIPYKTDVIQYLDEVDETAKKIGAVNTIAIRGGKSKGFNTDVIGFAKSIKPFLAFGMERALVLGTGGASKAVTFVLEELGLDVFYASRQPSGNVQLSYRDLNNTVMKAFKIIVNATPLGTFPNVEDCPDLPYEFLTTEHLLYDLVYNPLETKFMKKGKMRGASVVNGLSMLKIQAEESWKIWQGI